MTAPALAPGPPGPHSSIDRPVPPIPLLPEDHRRRVGGAQAVSISSRESLLSFQLYVGVPHGIVGPFSAYIQVFSSANFNPVCAGGSQTDFTLPHHSPSLSF